MTDKASCQYNCYEALLHQFDKHCVKMTDSLTT